MNRLVLILLFGFLFIIGVSKVEAQSGWHHHGGNWHQHPHRSWHYHNRVAYYPVIGWFPQGTILTVGNVYVYPNGRYVRFGTSYTFSRYNYYYRKPWTMYQPKPRYRGERPKR